MNDFHVYAIVSKRDNRIYVGISRDINRRVNEHNGGKVFSTKAFIPWNLLYSEYAGPVEIARNREKYYKSASGKRKLKKIFLALNSGSLPD
jgi:putative endonuclease